MPLERLSRFLLVADAPWRLQTRERAIKSRVSMLLASVAFQSYRVSRVARARARARACLPHVARILAGSITLPERFTVGRHRRIHFARQNVETHLISDTFEIGVTREGIRDRRCNPHKQCRKKERIKRDTRRRIGIGISDIALLICSLM